MSFLYRCQSCKVLGEMDELEAEVQCPQCGGVMLPIKDENGHDIFSGEDLDAPTVAVPTGQIMEELRNGATQAPKRPVKIAKAVDLGFGGLLSKTSTGPYRRPLQSQQPQQNEENVPAKSPPLPQQQESIPPKASPAGQSTASGKKKFVINKPAPANKTAFSTQVPQSPPPPPKPSVGATTTQKKIVFQSPKSHQSSTGISLNKETKMHQPNKAFATSLNSTSAPENPPQQRTNVPLKGKLIVQPRNIPVESPATFQQENMTSAAEEVDNAKEMEALLAEKTKIEAEEAAKKAIEQSSAIFSEKIMLEKQKAQLEAEKRIKEELAKLEQLKRELEEIKKKDSSKNKSEQESPETKNVETEAISSTMPTKPEEKKELEKDKNQNSIQNSFSKEQNVVLQEEKSDKKPELKKDNTEQEKKIEITKEEVKTPESHEIKATVEEKKETTDNLPELSLKTQESILQKNEEIQGNKDIPELKVKVDEKKEVPSQEKETPEKKEEKKENSIESKEQKEQKTDEKKVESEEKKEQPSKTEDSKVGEDKKASTLKKPILPKKGKTPFIPTKKIPQTQKTPVKSDQKQGSTKTSTGGNSKENISDKIPGQKKDTKSTQTKIPPIPENMTNSALIRLKANKTKIIYIIITAASLVACLLIIWLGTQLRKFLERRAAKNAGKDEIIIKRNPDSIPKESKIKVEYLSVYERVKKMPAGTKSDIDKIIAEWDNLIAKFPEDQNNEYVKKAKEQRSTMAKLKEMY